MAHLRIFQGSYFVAADGAETTSAPGFLNVYQGSNTNIWLLFNDAGGLGAATAQANEIPFKVTDGSTNSTYFRNYISYTGTAIQPNSRSPQIIENYIEKITLANSGWHLNGISLNGGQTNALILRNVVILQSPDDAGRTINQTDAIYFKQEPGTFPGTGTNLDGSIGYAVKDNYAGGGGLTIYAGWDCSYGTCSAGSLQNMKITGNQITTRWWPNGGAIGPIAHEPAWGSYGNVATNNTWADGPRAGQLAFGSGSGTSDTTPPSTPTNLSATAVSSSQINLSWSASTDNVGVTGYQIFRGGTLITTVTGTSYSNTGLTTNTSYSYTVKATDAAGNASANSSTASATTQVGTPVPTATISANPSSITSGNSSTLTWSSTNATSCTASNGWSGSKATSGTQSVAPTVTTTYSITCTGAGGTSPAASATVTVSGGGGGEADGIPAGFPNSTNTGYRNAPGYPGSLHSCSGPIQSNTTYSFCDFNGGVSVGTRDNPVSNVTFYGSRFHGAGESLDVVALYGDNITIDYSSIEPAVAAPPVSHTQGYYIGIAADGSYYTNVKQLTVTHSDIWGFSGGIATNGSTQAKPHVFRDNWVHDSRADGGVDHTDGIGETSGFGNSAYVVLDHNSIVAVGNTNGLAYQAGTYSNFTITNNYFSGFGYTVNLGNGMNNSSNFLFSANTFGTNLKPVWGPLYGWNNGSGNVWKCNKWHVVPGSYYTPTSDDGKFWTPNGVSATDYNGNTSCSGGGGGGDTTSPSTPSNLSASAVSSSQINLSWSASTDNVGVTGYQIFRGGTLLTTVTGTTYSNTGLTTNTSYSYTVKATDAAGNASANSNTASATTEVAPGDVVLPSAPTNLVATAVSSSQINLSWSASTDNVGVTGYRVFRGGVQVGTPSGTTYSNTGLTASTAYSYTVRAVDAAGNASANSNTASATTQGVTPPPPPPSTKFSINDRVQVASGPLNVRATANTTGTLLGTQSTSAFGTIVAGPTAQGGFNWWSINYDTGADGWSAEDYLVKAVTPPPPPPPAGSFSIFTSQTPAGSYTDGATKNYELGTKFQSAAAGQIVAIRFYKASQERRRSYRSHLGRQR